MVGAEIGPDEPLMDAGLDSLGAVEFKNALEGRMGVELPVTAVFDYPSVSALAGFIAAQTAGPEDAEQLNAGGPPSSSAVATHETPALSTAIAIEAAAAVTPTGVMDSPIGSDGITSAPVNRGWGRVRGVEHLI